MKIKILSLSILSLVTSVVFAGGGADSLALAGVDSVFTLNPGVDVDGFYLEPADVLEEGMVLSSQTVAADSVEHYIAQARAAIQKIRELNNFITNLDEASKFELPVGISKTIGGVTYDLAIHAIRLKPAYAELDVFLQFEVPQNGMILTFMARNIKLTNKGGIVGDATLELVGDYAINMNGNKSQIILKGSQSNGNTFVTIDCDGFKELGVDAEVKFSRDLIRPENADGSQAEGHVTASFSTVMTNWNDLVVQLTLPTFQVNGLPGVSFSVQEAVFDFSDFRNASNVQFPEGYETAQMLPDNPNVWRGFYMRELIVKLPREFKKRGSNERTTFYASNVVIDNVGFSGALKATELMTLQEGDMAGWAFSLESLQVEMRANQLVSGGFSGKIVIPVAKEETPFEYSAVINAGGNYVFSVSPAADLEFDVFKAGKVEIYEASYLEIKIADGKFLPKANLHGSMTIEGKLSEGGQGVKLANISFENLQLQTVKPYLKIGNFSFGSEAAQQKMAGFPIGITDIALKSISDTEVGLDFTLKLNLVGEDAGSFAADAGLTIIGKMNADRGWQSWRYKDINVREIGIDIDGGAFKFNGRLIFYRNDAAYGDGFNGTVKAEFKPGIKLSATAIFGNVNEMRYWYVDAMAELPSGIPIFTGVGIYGFGGGAYYRMKIDNEGLGSKLGQTASGVVYIPDERAGLGLKAVVSFGSHPKPEAFNGDVTFEIAFFRGGGVRYIAFGGNGYLVTPGLDLNMDKLKLNTSKMAAKVSNVNAAISGTTKGLLEGDEAGMTDIFGGIGEQAGKKGSLSAHVKISYDFENRVLHGNFEMYVNVAGGIIKGVGPGGRAGWAVLHFAPKEWYIYVGTPDDRIGISVGIGPIRASATSYFMVGTKILGSPPPPARVSKILGGTDLDYMKDLNALGTGAGFAFGAAFEVSTGDLTFLMFYARFDAGAGFDIMLKDYGDVRCKGSSDRLGINGWYANGQAYAYFEGSIGIRVRVFGKRKKIEILSIGAAAVLQAKLPNPFWMRGIVGGYFRVLGGLVKGNCKFEVTLGKECEIIKGENAILDDIKIISEITPAKSSTDVDVFTTPQALFNIPVDKEFELVDEDMGNIKRTFRIKLDHIKLISEGKPLEGNYKWNVNNDVLAFNSHEILPPKKDVTLSVQVSFEELKNGGWAPVLTDGQRTIQKEENTFKTGEAPDYIPHHNVEYSYPIIGQVNFYKDESRSGYIKLIKGQSYLFQPDAKWKQEGRFSNADATVARFDFNYSYSANMVSFSIPSSLSTDQIYTIRLVNVPAKEGGAVDRNVKTVTNKVNVSGQSVDTEITSKKAEGNIEELEEKDVYTALLRTSMFTTFNNKMNSFQYSDGWIRQIQLGVYELGTTMRGQEYFDKFEVGNSIESNANLIRGEADLSENHWYQDLVYPITYEGYPILGKATIDRSVEPLGMPPTRALFIRQLGGEGWMLTPENASGVKSLSPSLSGIIYNLSPEIYRDFAVIRAKCANLSVSTYNDQIHRILYASYPVIRSGSYKFKLRYYLPGTSTITTERNTQIGYR